MRGGGVRYYTLAIKLRLENSRHAGAPERAQRASFSFIVGSHEKHVLPLSLCIIE